MEIYRLMVLSRRVDDREILLKRQQKTYFQISCAGHEALQVGAALAMRPGYDWFFPYYRDRALCLTLGVTPDEMLLQAVGAATDPASGGRQMPTHWSSRELNIVSTSSATASQLLHAVGCAEAGRYYSRHPEAEEKSSTDYRAFHEVKFHGDEVVLTLLGEGSTSQGEFWEAMNTAANQQAAGHLLRGRQRLRHQHAGRGQYAGRQYLPPGGQLSQLPFCRGGRHRSGGQLPRL